VTDILIACCDGLIGLPEAIEATFPRATVQTCVVHLIRASMRFVSYTERKKVAAALRPIYTAASADAAETALLELTESDLGKRHPAVITTWQRAWERFTPFLAFPPNVRKIIYTTNAIESLNYQLRKIIKNRGHFPSDDAAIKLLWLAIRDIEDKRGRARAKEKGTPKGSPRKAPPRPASSRAPSPRAGNPRWPRCSSPIPTGWKGTCDEHHQHPHQPGRQQHDRDRLRMLRMRRADPPAAMRGLQPVHPPPRRRRPLPTLRRAPSGH